MHGRLIQIFLLLSNVKQANALLDELKQLKIPLNATMLTDCVTFASRLDPIAAKVLEFITPHPEVQMTLHAALLGARYFAYFPDIPTALQLFHILKT